jgi:hypothetical protein
MPAPAVQGCVEIGLFPLLSSPLQIAVINLLEQTFYHFNTKELKLIVRDHSKYKGFLWNFLRQTSIHASIPFLE